MVVSASGLLSYEDLLDSDGDDRVLARAPPGFEMVDARLLRREAELLLAGSAGSPTQCHALCEALLHR